MLITNVMRRLVYLSAACMVHTGYGRADTLMTNTVTDSVKDLRSFGALTVVQITDF